MKEDHRAILRSHVVALSVGGCGIVGSPEYLEKLGIRDGLRVERQLHDFRMPGDSTTDLLVGRIGDVPAAVTGLRGVDAPDTAEHGFCAPETPRSKSCGFRVRVCALPRFIENRESGGRVVFVVPVADNNDR